MRQIDRDCVRSAETGQLARHAFSTSSACWQVYRTCRNEVAAAARVYAQPCIIFHDSASPFTSLRQLLRDLLRTHTASRIFVGSARVGPSVVCVHMTQLWRALQHRPQICFAGIGSVTLAAAGRARQRVRAVDQQQPQDAQSVPLARSPRLRGHLAQPPDHLRPGPAPLPLLGRHYPPAASGGSSIGAVLEVAVSDPQQRDQDLESDDAVQKYGAHGVW
jgi:hypothetical protein